MEKTQWTQAQQKVIELRDRNILVSAAAGSGKTAVLVERIITRITEGNHPSDIDHLLIVTFTNAAASEMRERIGRAVEERLREQPDNAHLQKQMTLLHSAQITTIHSFCLNVIRNYFHLINLEPGFRLADEAELILLKSDVAEELLERNYMKGEEPFLQFIESYSTGKSDAGIEELLIKLYDFSVSYPWPDEWLEQKKDSFLAGSVDDMEQSDWMQCLISYIDGVIKDLPGKLSRAVSICRQKGGPVPYLDALQSDMDFIGGLAGLSSYGEYAEAFKDLKWQALKRVSKKDEVDEELKKQVQDIRKEVKDAVEEIRKRFFFQEEEEMLADIRMSAPVMGALVDLVLEFGRDFAVRKEEKKIIDFNDLEHFALNILVQKDEAGMIQPTDAAVELSEYYDEILIDEYQDSNLVQETILNSISRELRGQPNLFMVGDVKQSIYKFRLARPELFMEKYERYVKWEDGDSRHQRIDLHKNFRSREIVLSCVNYIFRRIMIKQLGNITYDDDAALYAGMEYEPCSQGNISEPPELILVCEEDMGEEMSGKREMEGKSIAARIKELTAAGSGTVVYDKEIKGYRTAEYRDIVILLRTMSGWAEEFSEILMAEGIPAYTDTRSGYFSAVEVRTVLNMLKVIDNPRQDIPLAAVLLSPAAGLTLEDMAEIRSACRRMELYDALTQYQEQGQKGSLTDKIKDFMDKLSRYREMVPYTDIHNLIEYVMEDTGYYRYAGVMPAGERRRANLDMLVKKAVDFEHTSYRGLFHFNRYIEKLHKYEVDFGEAAAGGDFENAVRIMSIHKSKGLEFPIVFVSGLGKSFNQQDARSRLVLHPELGLGPDYVDIKRRIKSPTLIKKVIQKQLSLENLGEELRVLYVALTRAKEKLIMTGAIAGREDAGEKWKLRAPRDGKEMEFGHLSSAGSYLDWIGPVLMEEGSLPLTIRYMKIEDLMGREIVSQAIKMNSREELLSWNTGIVYNEEIQEELEKQLSFVYPYLEEGSLPAKMTVTELKKLAQQSRLSDDEEGYYLHEDTSNYIITGDAEFMEQDKREAGPETEAPVPGFMQQEAVVSGTGRGTLYHKIMECIDLKRAAEPDGVVRELDRLASGHRIGWQDLLLVQAGKIEAFIQSDLCSRMIAAEQDGRLYREQKFVMGIPAGDLYSDIVTSEYILIQGIIDAYMEEAGGLVLIDYKTDRVNKGNERMLIERYRPQFDYYQAALEQLTHKKVKERYLYSFALGRNIPL